MPPSDAGSAPTSEGASRGPAPPGLRRENLGVLASNVMRPQTDAGSHSVSTMTSDACLAATCVVARPQRVGRSAPGRGSGGAQLGGGLVEAPHELARELADRCERTLERPGCFRDFILELRVVRVELRLERLDLEAEVLLLE